MTRRLAGHSARPVRAFPIDGVQTAEADWRACREILASVGCSEFQEGGGRGSTQQRKKPQIPTRGRGSSPEADTSKRNQIARPYGEK